LVLGGGVGIGLVPLTSDRVPAWRWCVNWGNGHEYARPENTGTDQAVAACDRRGSLGAHRHARNARQPDRHHQRHAQRSFVVAPYGAGLRTRDEARCRTACGAQAPRAALVRADRRRALAADAVAAELTP